MALFLIGDVQGCYDELRRLLDTCGFNDTHDHLVFLGDLVNRGPKSLAVLRYVKSLGDRATVLLGNHDLHLIATACGVRKPSKNDTFDDVLHSADADELIAWLRHQVLAHHLPAHQLLCVHAGVLPQWSLEQTLACAHELQQALRSDRHVSFLKQMYGNTPTQWRDELQSEERLRVIVNALTRLRFCNVAGEMELTTKEGAASAPQGYMPWFEVSTRKTAKLRIAFGHWSTLGLKVNAQIAALDTGCVWGGQLTALRLADSTQALQAEQLFQIACVGYQQPG